MKLKMIVLTAALLLLAVQYAEAQVKPLSKMMRDFPTIKAANAQNTAAADVKAANKQDVKAIGVNQGDVPAVRGDDVGVAMGGQAHLQYFVINMRGQVIKAGIAPAGFTVDQLGDLPHGLYYFILKQINGALLAKQIITR